VPGILRSRVAGILQEFRDHAVDFILVGGVAAVLDGVPVNTFDLDIVHSKEPDNIGCLLAALDSLEALKPDASHLASPGHQLLMTRLARSTFSASSGVPAATTICCHTHTNSSLARDCACGS
jgi:hypothetical protein